MDLVVQSQLRKEGGENATICSQWDKVRQAIPCVTKTKTYYPADGIYDSQVLSSRLSANYTDTNPIILLSLLIFFFFAIIFSLWLAFYTELRIRPDQPTNVVNSSVHHKREQRSFVTRHS